MLVKCALYRNFRSESSIIARSRHANVCMDQTLTNGRLRETEILAQDLDDQFLLLLTFRIIS